MELKEIEKIIKQKSNNRCIICHNKAEQIYALEEKDLEEDNLILLCQFCAHKYLGNPDIIKQIKQMRDYWYEQVQRAIKQTGGTEILSINEEENLDTQKIAIYHVVYENEGLEESAKTIYELLCSAKEQGQNKPRILYLDIDGHTDKYGKFDEEMLELQQNLLLQTLLPYFEEMHTPILDVKNTEPQKNDFPKEMIFIPNEEELIKQAKQITLSGGYIIEKIQKNYYEDNKTLVFFPHSLYNKTI